MGDAVRLALTTLTVAPLHAPAQVTRAVAGRAMSLAPLVGVLLGAAAAAVAKAAHLRDADLLAAVLAVALLAVLTRGLHLDGLADSADGLASYRPAARALEVMRSPEVGPVGLVTVVLVLLTQIAAVEAAITAGRGTGALVVAAASGRLAVTLACTPRTPAAAPTGLGAMVAGTVTSTAAAAGAVAVLGLAVVAGAVDVDTPLLLPATAVVAALAVMEVVRRHAVRRLGGITGDVLGALVELTTTVVLVVMAVG